jgi:hypothetical protein
MQEIVSTISNHLSYESKRNLITELRSEVHDLRRRLASANEEELRGLAHQYGLGNVGSMTHY